MKKKRIFWLAVSCLMVAALLVTSCNGTTTDDNGVNGVVDEEDIDEVTTEIEEVDDGKDMVTNTAGKLVEKPRYGGWYNLAITVDIRGFDDVMPASPAYMTYTLNLTHDELYTGNWALGPQGSEDASLTVGGTYLPHIETPCLATGYELPDSETIIWHIRQGVRFQNRPPANGRELNAHDIVYNLKRTYLTKGSYLFNTYRQDRGQGPTSIKAIDDWTVEMKVPPDRQVPLLFASNDYVYHHNPEAIDEYGDATTLAGNLGTGPFIMTDYIPVSSITFERNPSYWMKNPLHPEDQLPYIDGVTVLVIADTTTSQAAFRTGKIEVRAGIVKDDWESLTKTSPQILWRRAMPQGCATIYMRTDNPELPYDDIRVRKALFYGIDHMAIVEDYFEGEGVLITAPIADIPEFKDMFTPLEGYPEEVQKLYGYYPEEAIELLAEAGYPDGFSATILTSAEDMIPIIKDMWSKIGVDITVDLKTSPVVSSMTMRGQHEDMYYGGLSGAVVLKVNQWRTDSYLNYSKVDNAEFNKWFEEFNTSMLDWDKLCRMTKEMEPKLRAEAYFIDLPNDYTYFMWNPWLRGWTGETSVGYFNGWGQLPYLWIDTEMRGVMTGRED